MNERRGEDYLLGTHREELIRLGFQHRVWAREAYDLWRRAGFGYGQTLLDLGCGPGYTSLDLAHLVGPEGQILAVDASSRFLGYLRRQAAQQGVRQLTTVCADVHDLELPERLDGAYARWLMCFVEDPERVVRRVARALKPGAPFAVTDYFRYQGFTFGPPSPVLDRVAMAVVESWRLAGGDMEIQGRMPGIMERCGLRVTEVKSNALVARPGSPLWFWPVHFFTGYLPRLVTLGLVTEQDRRAFDEEFRRRADDPGSFLCLPPMFDVVGVKR